MTTTDAASERELHGAIRKALGEIKNGKEPEPVDWESLLRNTFQGVETPVAEEWCVGGGDPQADARGGRVFCDIDSEEEPRGGEASWLRRSDIDDQGFLSGWMERAGDMRSSFSFDKEGYLCSRHGGRIELQQLTSLDPAVQIVARARLALGNVEVVAGDGIKRQHTHVQLSMQRGLWEKLTASSNDMSREPSCSVPQVTIWPATRIRASRSLGAGAMPRPPHCSDSKSAIDSSSRK
jgi:hypothetical protein